MKKFFSIPVLLLVAGSTFSATARADIISCLNEDIVTTYSFAQQSLTIHDDDSNKETVLENVSLQIKGPASFILVDQDHVEIQDLDLNNQGSDGNSDRIFPYAAHWTSAGAAKYKIAADSIYSGCESNYLKATGQK